jgi:uncharacterized membrane protein
MKISNLFHYVGLALVIIGFLRQSFEKNDYNLVLIGICLQFIGLIFYYINKNKNNKKI